VKDLKEQVKNSISGLINDNKLMEARLLIDEYIKIMSDDVEAYSIKAVILIMQEEYVDAEYVIKHGLNIDKCNFDLNYNLAYIFEKQNHKEKALNQYKTTLGYCTDESSKKNIEMIIQHINGDYKSAARKNKKKIAFFVKQGMDSFIGNVISGLSEDYETKKIVVTQYNQIDEGMEWADITWFEWCDELVVHGSNLDIAKEKRVICRLHSYEAFTDYPLKVNWDNVDCFICDTVHIKDIVLEKVDIDNDKILIVPVGVETSRFNFSNRKKGFNVAYVGYINYKKGPMFLIQLINALKKEDNRYRLFVGGEFQDQRDILYFRQMIKELNLENNLVYQGWIENVNEWLEDKQYIVSTSLLEGQHLSVMEGMCKGIKPIIHNFVGAKQVYDKKYVWNTINEAVAMIKDESYDSEEYRKYIVDNYSNEKQLMKIKSELERLQLKHKYKTILSKEPMVTIGIINYNYSRYLDDSIQSVLNQSYKNIELLIIDDCSQDDSVEKIKNYETNHKNIRGIYHNENSGSALLGVQEVINEAKGEYLMILSADDYLTTGTAIFDFVNSITDNPDLDYVYPKLRIVNSDGTYKDTWQYKQFTHNDVIHDVFHRGGSGILPVTTGLYKTSFYRRNNLNWYDDKENVVAGDTLNSLIYIKNNFKYKYINKELVSYRHHEKNMTYDLRNRIKSIISVIEYIINNFSEEIYLSEIQWREFSNSNERESEKMYQIGMHYVNILNYYASSAFKPWDGANVKFSEEDIKIFIKPLALKASEYLQKSLYYSNKYYMQTEEVSRKIKDLID
jgi:glycosyltransferase involved in cell wall biosynthesis